MKRYAAELIGTFILVLGGCGSAVLAGDRIGFLGISLAFGLTLMALVYAIGPISGCHVNPAVTLGMVAAKKMKPAEAPGYILAQIVGATLAAAVILAVAKGSMQGYDQVSAGLGANGFDAHSPGLYNFFSAIISETILTFLLVFTVLRTTDKSAPPGFAGLAIGVVLTVIHLVGIPITGTSVNPARSIGPALIVGDWAISQLWVFIIAPILGGYFAAALYGLFADETQEEEVRAPSLAGSPEGNRA